MLYFKTLQMRRNDKQDIEIKVINKIELTKKNQFKVNNKTNGLISSGC